MREGEEKRMKNKNSPEKGQTDNAYYCERLRAHLTQNGCKGLRESSAGPKECKGCPGVSVEKRVSTRRTSKVGEPKEQAG